jgi:hypothetical protein
MTGLTEQFHSVVAPQLQTGAAPDPVRNDTFGERDGPDPAQSQSMNVDIWLGRRLAPNMPADRRFRRGSKIPQIPRLAIGNDTVFHTESTGSIGLFSKNDFLDTGKEYRIPEGCVQEHIHPMPPRRVTL